MGRFTKARHSLRATCFLADFAVIRTRRTDLKIR
jgi:hypothetical protein